MPTPRSDFNRDERINRLEVSPAAMDTPASMSDSVNGGFKWGWLGPQIMQPIQVGMIEALLWIDRPIAPSDLARMCNGEHSASLIAYHANALAEFGVLRLADTEPVRGATRHLYVLTQESLWEWGSLPGSGTRSTTWCSID